MSDGAAVPLLVRRRPRTGEGLRERARRERYEKIRQAAETLLQERPFDEITTRDVARLAGVGEATLFRYIANKEELLLMVVGRKVEELVVDLEGDRRFRTFLGTDPPEVYLDGVYEVYRRRAAFCLTDPENVTNYSRIGLKPGSELGSRSVAHGDRVIAVVRHVVAEGQRHGALLDVVPAQLVAENCNGLFMHELLRSPTREFTPDTFTDRILRRLSGQLVPLCRATVG